mmetsp:Transcript_14997/g.25643  ORF Transcript_14997/g.25643 Transcript_14997/m.25643 type:complete len:229 (+) Transcript_14997:234-920(+)
MYPLSSIEREKPEWGEWKSMCSLVFCPNKHWIRHHAYIVKKQLAVHKTTKATTEGQVSYLSVARAPRFSSSIKLSAVDLEAKAQAPDVEVVRDVVQRHGRNEAVLCDRGEGHMLLGRNDADRALGQEGAQNSEEGRGREAGELGREGCIEASVAGREEVEGEGGVDVAEGEEGDGAEGVDNGRPGQAGRLLQEQVLCVLLKWNGCQKRQEHPSGHHRPLSQPVYLLIG